MIVIQILDYNNSAFFFLYSNKNKHIHIYTPACPCSANRLPLYTYTKYEQRSLLKITNDLNANICDLCIREKKDDTPTQIFNWK